MILLLSVTGQSTAAPREISQPDETVVPLLDPAAMPEYAIPVARAATTSRSATAMRFPFDPQPEYITSPTNYWEGRDGASIDYIVIHYTDISYARTLHAFNTLSSDVSAHYVVRGDGHIAQLVAEGDTAWHSGNVWYNRHSIGIEFELDRVTNPAFTTEQYYAGAALACAISARQGIPLDREHVIGHNEVPGSTHTDPGPTWDWPHFMWLVSLCAPPTAATVHASFVSESPYPEISADDRALVSVVLRNTGSTAWRKGTGQEARLGIPGNSPDLAFLADDWPAPERPAIQQEDIVPPGGTATFSFRVKGALPGTFVVPLRGVVDGGAWMDDMGMFTVVTVR
jgi:N-acetyl-anhydromuramyl-L-alanine amidase AmpD